MNKIKDIYEKAGLFYLGKDVDKNSFEPTETLTLLKNKNFTTHATIIGMTGSGKTGLGIGIIEEAAIDNIPAIVIDPKGDMGNLCLTDPEFSAESFKPWVEEEALSKGEEPLSYASKIASFWKKGIETYGQDKERVAKFHKVKKTIYTPGSQAGVPINLMDSLSVPDKKIMEDSDSFASYLKSSVMGLLSLIGIEADPLDSKEYILLSQIIAKAWLEGKDLGIEELVGKIINPPFKKIGVLPLKAFYPDNERFKLATRFNSVIASPTFANWLTGEPLNIQKLLYDEKGKAKISIFSISHLNDEEKMFFVTLLLNKYIAWMRLQSGSSRLKTILYMDEIYGFFPPVKNPPSKEPMITLLKQARAYGIGIILSTQNPVDLDYKALSNMGTWFIGRLQTKQDINRVIDGLSGKVDSSFNRKEIENILSNLKKRTFFLKSAHLEDIRLFTTRWVLSYLKGPLKKTEISQLMENQKPKEEVIPTGLTENYKNKTYEEINTLNNTDIPQYYEIDITGEKNYTPFLAAQAEVYFYEKRRNIETTEEKTLYLDLSDLEFPDWEQAEEYDLKFLSLPKKEPENSKFAPIPEFIINDKGLKKSKRELINYLYKNMNIEIYRCKALKLESNFGDTLSDFKMTVEEKLKELKEEKIEKLIESYERKEKKLKEQLTRALEKVEKEKRDQMNSFINAGVSIIAALFGRTTSRKIGTTISKSSRAYKERTEVSLAEKRVKEIEEKILNLEEELEEKIKEISEKYHIDNYKIESLKIKPKKRDISIEAMGIVWRAI